MCVGHTGVYKFSGSGFLCWFFFPQRIDGQAVKSVLTLRYTLTVAGIVKVKMPELFKKLY